LAFVIFPISFRASLTRSPVTPDECDSRGSERRCLHRNPVIPRRRHRWKRRPGGLRARRAARRRLSAAGSASCGAALRRPGRPTTDRASPPSSRRRPSRAPRRRERRPAAPAEPEAVRDVSPADRTLRRARSPPRLFGSAPAGEGGVLQRPPFHPAECQLRLTSYYGRQAGSNTLAGMPGTRERPVPSALMTRRKEVDDRSMESDESAIAVPSGDHETRTHGPNT
jgi:hypothetical protein